MGFFNGVKRIVTPLVNFPKWMDAKGLARSGKMIKDIYVDITTPEEGDKQESFNEALDRLKLTEKELALRKKQFTRMFWFYMVIAIGLLCYCVYHIYFGHFKAAVLSLAVSTIPLSLAFRFHFWLFQMKKKKLGCSVSEWFREGILRR